MVGDAIAIATARWRIEVVFLLAAAVNIVLRWGDGSKRFGDWEADTLQGAHHQGAMVTLVERQSRLTLAAPVDHRNTACVQPAIVLLLQPVAQWVQTITVDNGRECSGHRSIVWQLDCAIYFAQPYPSWARATHENGLRRHYFPKKQSLRGIVPSEVGNAVTPLNQRPRKCRGFTTPAEVFQQLSKGDYNLGTQGAARTG